MSSNGMLGTTYRTRIDRRSLGQIGVAETRNALGSAEILSKTSYANWYMDCAVNYSTWFRTVTYKFAWIVECHKRRYGPPYSRDGFHPGPKTAWFWSITD